jgi:hypothetical protein
MCASLRGTSQRRDENRHRCRARRGGGLRAGARLIARSREKALPQAKRRRCAKRRQVGRYGQPESESDHQAASYEAPRTTRSGLVPDEAVSNLSGSPCAIAGMANRCLFGRPGPSISLPSADNLIALDGLDESAFTPNWQMICVVREAIGGPGPTRNSRALSASDRLAAHEPACARVAQHTLAEQPRAIRPSVCWNAAASPRPR